MLHKVSTNDTQHLLAKLVNLRLLLAVTTNLKVLASLQRYEHTMSRAYTSCRLCQPVIFCKNCVMHITHDLHERYLDGVHMHSLALLTGQPQHNLLCGLSLQLQCDLCSFCK